ncbi:hypothetical protein [Endozoicomonas euniceicola]|uniref:Uncharacterized protein n=1 Tax=Endozoicomonas euniceicola TaxID=1234143 RepID=A0ABY6GPH7_9GAMM|nr:hypothetical protein [Endozoicomonas euniceicola]UYM14051.1 hypothetical protein NX720_14140 [Endozoicomonas euniceicola]
MAKVIRRNQTTHDLGHADVSPADKSTIFFKEDEVPNNRYWRRRLKAEARKNKECK